MAKNIILLSDGTGNSAAKVWRTNVWRLFQALDLKGSGQIAIYDDGVGTSSFKPLALLGGAFGWGLERNVINLYKFLCRNYRPGDKIYGFGFSRGAFTIRIVAGLVLNQGLVDFASESDLDKKAHAAYRAYRHEKYSRSNLQYPYRLIRVLLDKLFYTPRQRVVPNIDFLGVWDTVAAYGLPVDEMTRGVDRWIWPLELPNTQFNRDILRARHALAIDDERATFHPVLWDEDASNTQPAGPQRSTSGEQLLQVWFTGMHANVGGGYPDDSLANVSLSWMMAEARQSGLVFKEIKDAEPDALLATDSAKDKDGRLYDSRSGVGGYYRYSPRKIMDFYQPMQKAAERDGARSGSLVPKIHESVFGRIKIGAHLYAPIGLPPNYEVVTTGDVSLVYSPLPPGVAPDPLTIEPNATTLAEGSASSKLRHEDQQTIWDLVWRKRAVYFLTVFATGYLLLYPLFRDSYAFQELRTRLRLVSDAVRLLGSVLPGFATRWLDAYARDPAWFLVNIVVVVLLTVTGARIAARIRDEMRHIWVRHLPGTTAPSSAVVVEPSRSVSAIVLLVGLYLTLCPLIRTHVSWLAVPGVVGEALGAYMAPPISCVLGLLLIACFLPRPLVRALREWPPYQTTIKMFKYKIAPFASAFGLLFLALELGAHYTFNLADSFGTFCTEMLSSSKNGFKDDQGPTISMDAANDDRCMSTGVFLSAATKYRIRVARDPDKWTFWGVESFMGGQPISRLPWYKEWAMAGLFPLRRTLDRPWGALILRIGAKGNEEDFLDRDPPEESDGISVTTEGLKIRDKESLSETLTPKRDGELFVYLNKSVWYYGLLPTTGKAEIIVDIPDK
jgi:uncharacterized protein (DUF2235 family)